MISVQEILIITLQRIIELKKLLIHQHRIWEQFSVKILKQDINTLYNEHISKCDTSMTTSSLKYFLLHYHTHTTTIPFSSK